MALPNEPVTLSVEQITELNRKLSTMRHDINGKLTQISLAVELLRLKPDGGDRWLGMMADQPQKIVAELAQFSRELEAALHITRS
jgi:signal transduction histidine kinase